MRNWFKKPGRAHPAPSDKFEWRATTVTRVKTSDGEHLEPAGDVLSTPLEHLRWIAGAIRCDTGLDVKVCLKGLDADGKTEMFGVKIPGEPLHWADTASDYAETRIFLKGMKVGIEAKRDPDTWAIRWPLTFRTHYKRKELEAADVSFNDDGTVAHWPGIADRSS